MYSFALTNGFLDRVKKEQEQHGGAYIGGSASGSDQYKLILGGPYAGTYIFFKGRPQIRYLPSILLILDPYLGQPSKIQIANKLADQIWKKLAPALAVCEAASELGVHVYTQERQIKRTKTKSAHPLKVPEYEKLALKKLMALGLTRQAARDELFDHMRRREPGPIMRIIMRYERERDQAKHPSGSEREAYMWENMSPTMKKLIRGSVPLMLADRLTVRIEQSGLPASLVLKDLAENPKRLYAIRDDIESTISLDLKERRTFARTLLTTWSIQKAYKSVFPNVEGSDALPQYLNKTPQGVSAAGLEFSARSIKQLLNKAASWKQNFSRTGVEGAKSVPSALNFMGRLAQASRILPLKAEEVRDVVHRYNQVDLTSIIDSIRIINNNEAALREERRGMWAIQHYLNKDWGQVLKDHDWLAEFQAEQEAPPQPGDEVYEAWHAQGRSFDLPDGVKPLVTRRDFVQEGKALRHCVAGYFAQRATLCFGFTSPAGNRATLELEYNRFSGGLEVRQFYGPYNRAPAPELASMLRDFLNRNAGWAPIRAKPNRSTPRSRKNKRR